MGRKILADAGYDVVTVNNGSAALKRITELKPDLIVLDVYMPGYSGLEVCQRLKDSAETSHIPVLLTVGKLEPFKPEEARRVKADAHIVKPFEASELLTAITRLEDRVVPQPTEGNTDLDTGWKSRLRFPSKKKKDEPEPEPEQEDFAAGLTFRDFRRGKTQTESSPVFEVKAQPEPEPALVPDIPRDVTPEELDALSALAAKLDAPISAESPAPLAEEAGPIEAPAAEVARNEVEVPAAAAEEKSAEEAKAIETPAPPAVEIVEPAAAAVEAPAFASEANREVEIPAEPAELTSKVAPTGDDPAAVVAAVVNTALFAVEPAPVDRDEEPIFASAPTAVEPAREDLAAERIEGKPAEELTAEKAAAPTVPAAVVSAYSKGQEAAEADERVPSDADLAEALRLLTPATVHAEVSTVPSPGTLVAAGSRWVAEPVTLSPEEAAISLEAEMFSTFTATPGAEIGSVRINGVSAIAAAVENRLAEAEMAASTKASAQPGTEHGLPEYGLAEHALVEPGLVEPGLVEHGAESTAAETSVVEAPAEAMASVSNPATPSADGTELESEKKIAAETIEPETIEPEKVEPGKMEAEQTRFLEKIAEEERATFADAVDRDEIKAAAEPSGEPADEAVAGSESNQDSSSEVGGRESMGTDGKAKSGKSNWRRIHTAPQSAAATSDVVEAAKQAEQAAEEAPRVMAAAAAEGSTTASSADASTIAGIVDRVMADLRPKIVEEIAKKLAGK